MVNRNGRRFAVVENTVPDLAACMEWEALPSELGLAGSGSLTPA
jgi:hypothetical protein